MTAVADDITEIKNRLGRIESMLERLILAEQNQTKSCIATAIEMNRSFNRKPSNQAPV